MTHNQNDNNISSTTLRKTDLKVNHFSVIAEHEKKTACNLSVVIVSSSISKYIQIQALHCFIDFQKAFDTVEQRSAYI